MTRDPNSEAAAPTILQVVPELDAGGVERTAVDVAAACVKRGWRAVIATRGGRLEDEASAAGAEILTLKLHSKNPVTIVANAFALASFVRAQKVALIHARSRAPAWSALMAARMTGVPFVTTYAGIYNEGFPGKRLYNSVMARGAAVIANSSFTADHVRKAHGLAGDKLVVIPRGIDLSHFDEGDVAPDRIEALRKAWGAKPGRRIVLLPGRLTRWKGQLVAIEAIAELGRQDVLLVLAGDAQGRDAYAGELQSAIATRHLDQAVHICGHVSDMAAAYLASDVVLSCSLEPEAFGRVAVEAQAMGRPIIATDLGGARETVRAGETGLLIPPGDAPALARSIEAVLAMSEGERAALAARAKAHARARYSRDAMCAATLAVYERLLRC